MPTVEPRTGKVPALQMITSVHLFDCLVSSMGGYLSQLQCKAELMDLALEMLDTSSTAVQAQMAS